MPDPTTSDRAPAGGGSADDAFTAVLSDVVDAFGDAAIPFGVLGGVASAAYGRPRWTKDIDVFCRAELADQALEVLAERDFTTERTNPAWIFKGWRDEVLVDVIFKAKADIYFDEPMAERVRRMTFQGVEVPVISPEDIVVMKAVSTDEATPWHWYDALGIMAVNELDWEYFLERARKGPNRVVSLLHFALSIDVPVPTKVVRRLHEYVATSWEG
jgi:predicted nucleotidyltransferase